MTKSETIQLKTIKDFLQWKTNINASTGLNINQQMSEELLLNDRRGNLIHGLLV